VWHTVCSFFLALPSSSFPWPCLPPARSKSTTIPPLLWLGVSASRLLLLGRRTCTWHVPSARNELSLKALINSRNQQVCLYCLFSLSWICQDRLDCCQGHSICCKWMKRYLVDFFRTALRKGKAGAKLSVGWQIKSASRSQRVFLSEPWIQLSEMPIPCQRRGYYTACWGKVAWQYTDGKEQTRDSGIAVREKLGSSSPEISRVFTCCCGGRERAAGSRRSRSSLCESPQRPRTLPLVQRERGVLAPVPGWSGWCAPEASSVLGHFCSWGVTSPVVNKTRRKFRKRPNRSQRKSFCMNND